METTADDRKKWVIRGDDAGRAIRDLNRALERIAELEDALRIAKNWIDPDAVPDRDLAMIDAALTLARPAP